MPKQKGMKNVNLKQINKRIFSFLELLLAPLASMFPKSGNKEKKYLFRSIGYPKMQSLMLIPWQLEICKS
jgi:hypothetical protein